MQPTLQLVERELVDEIDALEEQLRAGNPRLPLLDSAIQWLDNDLQPYGLSLAFRSPTHVGSSTRCVYFYVPMAEDKPILQMTTHARLCQQVPPQGIARSLMFYRASYPARWYQMAYTPYNFDIRYNRITRRYRNGA